ncbi:hypothetical protein CG740_03740 [Streptomyces sp. CB01201]|uniref:hypothetical protein n=1 Tax=unclassified Streptomyces TaxID=2593676 RepID=UPI000C27BBB9|nr:hypothetical protein [Streptomyces sp. CB01201]PJN04988.1 hypothetical protein CG740_03740 [Streptomyces sp. CB01201]
MRTTPRRPLDIEAAFPELAEYRATATRLHPRPGCPGETVSSVGGKFLWPAAEAWPVCREAHPKGRGQLLQNVRKRRQLLTEVRRRPGGPTPEERELLISLRKRRRYDPDLADTAAIPLLPVAQLYTRDVPDLTGPEDMDLLQVFWCPFDAHGERRTVAVHLVWRRAGDVVEPMTESPQPVVVGNDGYVPEPCVLNPERVVEHQDIELLPESLQERLEEWEATLEERHVGEGVPLAYGSDFSVAPGWKVGGFAAWNLTGPAEPTCACGAPMVLLLNVHSREWDGGNHSWVPVEDRPFMDDRGASTPTGIVVGTNALRIFQCSADPTHAHQVNEQ